MSQTPLSTAPLSPYWAFVVQLREGTSLTPQDWSVRESSIRIWTHHSVKRSTRGMCKAASTRDARATD